MRRGAVYPPSIPHTSRRLSTSSALERISTYLSASETNAYLHPDAIIEPGGIHLSRTSAGPSGGIVMHHLRRIKAGLSGEVLALDAEELMFTQGQEANGAIGGTAGGGGAAGTAGDPGSGVLNSESQTQHQAQSVTGAQRGSEQAFPKRWKSNVGADGMPIKSALKKTAVARDDGVDPDDFAVRQEAVEGEYGERDGAPVAHEIDAPPAIAQTGMKRGAASVASKEARKAEKKARRKKEKSSREEARKAG